MKTFRILVLTDHRGHSAENSLYALVSAMVAHPSTEYLDIVSRGSETNPVFWTGAPADVLDVIPVAGALTFDPAGVPFRQAAAVSVSRPTADYDLVWLRLPPPLQPDWLRTLGGSFPKARIVNDPAGILLTGSKAFLLNFPELVTQARLCTNIEAIDAVRRTFPCVLKPLRDYGGHGLVRIDGDQVWEGKQHSDFETFRQQYAGREYLAVPFLKNVSQGDKRLVVVSGEVLGASLRLPGAGSWLCNVAAGGSSNPAEADGDERRIVQTIAPRLAELGIVMYGVDTLVGDDGRRVLSEINTTSIGGLPQIERMSGRPVVRRAVDLILQSLND